MNKKIVAVVISILWIVTTCGAVGIGFSIGQRMMLIKSSVALENIQAKLLLERIEDENHLRDLLNKKCIEISSEFVYHKIDFDMILMHDFIVRKNMDDAISYIKYRDPNILIIAKKYTSQFQDHWEEKSCN